MGWEGAGAGRQAGREEELWECARVEGKGSGEDGVFIPRLQLLQPRAEQGAR